MNLDQRHRSILQHLLTILKPAKECVYPAKTQQQSSSNRLPRAPPRRQPPRILRFPSLDFSLSLFDSLPVAPPLCLLCLCSVRRLPDFTLTVALFDRTGWSCPATSDLSLVVGWNESGRCVCKALSKRGHEVLVCVAALDRDMLRVRPVSTPSRSAVASLNLLARFYIQYLPQLGDFGLGRAYLAPLLDTRFASVRRLGIFPLV